MWWGLATLLLLPLSHADEPSPNADWSGWAQRAAASEGPEVRAIRDLGRRGTQEDLSALTPHLSRPWPFNAAAAFAIGELARREAADTRSARGSVIGLLSAFDPRTREAAADAIRRMGLDSDNAEQLQHVVKLSQTIGVPRAQACLIQALEGHLDEETGSALWVQGVGGTERSVRAATIRHLSEYVPADVLSLYLMDPDPWVRLETARALTGRTGDVVTDALRDYVTKDEDPWAALVAGRASEALSDPDSKDALLRLAAVEHHTEPAALLRVALQDADTRVRVAAADKLRREDLSAPTMSALAGSDDPVVASIGTHGLIEVGPRSDDIQRAIACVEGAAPEHEDLLVACLDLLQAAKPRGEHPMYRRAVKHLRQRPQSSTRVSQRLGAPPSAPEITSDAAARLITVDTTKGTFRMQLEPDTAPQTVSSFLQLTTSGFYNGVPVHRVVPGFVAQTGCPRGDGWGGPGYSLPDEFSDEPFSVGAVGLARGENHSGGSQWFIMTGEHPHLVGRYTRFGHVISGMDVVRHLTVGDVIERVTIDAR